MELPDTPSSQPADLASMDLDHIPDNRRGALQHWLTHCRDKNPNEEEWGWLWDEHTTSEEITAFLAPFDQAEELHEALMQMRQFKPVAVDDATLLQAAKDYVAEMADNATLVGEADLAARARAVARFQVVEQIDGPAGVETLESEIDWVIGDAIQDDAFAHPDRAVASLLIALGQWHMGTYEEGYVMRPLIRPGLRFDAFFRLWSLGCETSVVADEALVTRPPIPPPVQATPPARISRSSAEKKVAREQADWTAYPTAAADIAALVAAGDAGDHPSLAKLSLMYMAGIAVDFDLPRAFGLLERAAGDGRAAIQCYEAGQRLGVAAADYGLYYLAMMGWGMRKNDERAAAYLQAAAEGGFPHAMYLLGMNYRSGTDKDLNQAEMWQLKAAATGYPNAYRMLYHLYENGDLKDNTKALFWLKRAAHEGAGETYQHALAVAYEGGELVDKDLVSSYAWFSVAAHEGRSGGAANSADQDRVAADMSDVQIEQAQVLAQELQSRQKGMVR